MEAARPRAATTEHTSCNESLTFQRALSLFTLDVRTSRALWFRRNLN